MVSSSPERPSTASTRPRTRHRRTAGALIAVATAALALAGCSGSDKSGSSSDAGMAAGGAAEPAPATAAATAGGGLSSSSTGTSTTATAADRSIVRTASMTVATPDVDDTANRILALVGRSGERVDGDKRSSSGDSRTAELTLRVLPARLDQVIAAVDKLGTETTRSVQGDDVTAARADMDARISALSTSISRLQNFLAQATSVPNLLAVETQLSARQGELDSMKAKQRVLADQIGLASLTVDVVQKGTPAAVVKSRDHGPAGFGSAVSGGWHGLVVSWRWLIAVLGYALPIGALVLLLGAGGFTWYRRQRRPEPGPVSAEPEPETASV